MSLRNRIETLERTQAGAPVLVLDDGTTRTFPGLEALDFLEQGMSQIRERSGPIFDAIGRAVDGRNCGWEVLAVMAHGPIEDTCG